MQKANDTEQRISSRTHRALATKVAAAATTYGFTILLARCVAPEVFGQVAYFLNAAFLLSVLGAVGQQMLVTRFVPAQLAGGNLAAARGTASSAFDLAFKGTVLVYGAALSATLALQQVGFFEGFETRTLVLGYALILVVGWSDLVAHLCRASRLIQLSLLPKEILWRAISAAFILAVCLGADEPGFGAASILIILIGTLILVTTLQAALLRQRTGLAAGFRHKPRHDDNAQRQCRKPFWITSVSNVFLTNADVMVVAMILGPAEAGYYFAANRLALLLSFFITSNNIVIAPAMSAAWGEGDGAKAHKIACEATRRMTPPTLILAALLAAGAPYALTFFGPEYAGAANVLRILALAAVVNAATGPADIALNMSGHDAPAMRVSILSLVFSIVALVAGTLLFGSLGTATAVLLGTTFRKFAFWDLARRKLALNCDYFSALSRQRQHVPS